MAYLILRIHTKINGLMSYGVCRFGVLFVNKYHVSWENMEEHFEATKYAIYIVQKFHRFKK